MLSAKRNMILLIKEVLSGKLKEVCMFSHRGERAPASDITEVRGELNGVLHTSMGTK